MKATAILLSLGLLFFSACQQKEKVDLLLTNGKIYTVDQEFTIAEAVAIKNGKFLEVGTSEDLINRYKPQVSYDLEGLSVYPGLIDGHSHFLRYARGLADVDLVGTKSLSEMLSRIEEHIKRNPEQEWISGWGWDQNDWDDNEFPTKDSLDALFPDKVFMLTRIDGHAVLTNSKGLQLAGINSDYNIKGGEVIVRNNEATGVLIDNAIDALEEHKPELSNEQVKKLALLAQQNLFQVGITSLAEAGLHKSEIDLLDELHKDSLLKLKVYAMLNPTNENIDHYFSNGHYKTDRLHVRSFKMYADGALGSRGACLLSPYHDDPDNYGFLRKSIAEMDSLAEIIHAKNFQLNTHCIGDSANRVITSIYAKHLEGKNDKRWRIEHAQVIHPSNIKAFANYNIIPSVQPTHATSDMAWAEDRLGPVRINHAYIYNELLETNGMLVLGSDFPVENINPLFGIHAAVSRQDEENKPSEGFLPENAISREAAVRASTIWAAKGQFEEEEKGSIESGKYADFIILDQDIMQVDVSKIRNVKVLQTYVSGELVFNELN